MKKRLFSHFGIIVFAALLLANCKNPDDSPKSAVVSIAAIQGVTVPVTGWTPDTAITENEQYTGTVIWKVTSSGSTHTGAFAAVTQYTATITLTAKHGYTLQGVTANFFTVAGATTVSNTANSGVITAVFPTTASTSGNSTRSVTIDMYDFQGDGWDGGGALRINVNGVDIAGDVKVQSGSTNTYTFNVATGDVVRLYWVAGSYQEENSFIVYYTSTPPSPAFTTSNNNSWNGSNALIYKLRGTMSSISNGTLLGSFTVQNGNVGGNTAINIAAIQGVTAPVTGGTPVTAITENIQYSGTVTWSPNHSTFAASTVYTAAITLSPKDGYTLQGVMANFFTVAGGATVSNSANSGVITAVFPVTASTNGSSTRQVTIDMYDSYGDGWDGNGALRINVNGVDIANNVKVQSGSTNTYTFNVATGDIVRLYWVAGTSQEENSFIVYYTNTPPSPAFTTSNNSSWNGSNALAYKLRGTMNSISNGTLLGSFTVQNGNVGGNTVVSIAVILGVTAPVTGAIPVTSITENEQYSGTVTWKVTSSGSAHTGAFAASTQYTATVTLTAKSGYTLQGVTANFFTVAGATSVSNSANSGVITAVFPQTVTVTPDSRFEYYWVDQHGSLVTTSGGAVTVAVGATLTITAQSTGYVVKQWHLDGINTGQSGNTYSFSSITAGKHTIGLFVEKDGRLYNTNITITVVTSNGSETSPFLLTASVWENGSITSITNTVWYSFNVTSGTTYRVWWNDSYQGNSTKTLDVRVSATYSNGTAIFTGVDSGYTTAQSFTANQTGTVKLKVYPLTSGNTGTFAVVYSTSSTRP